MTLPFVSVIIPCYNAEEDIEACLQGVLGQKYPTFEVIVVDDASTDKTLELLRVHQTIKLVRNSENLGPGGTRNRGIMKSKGELLVSLDSDSVVEDPEWLAKHATVQASLDRTIVGGRIRGIGRGLVAHADSYCHWLTNIPDSHPAVITASSPYRFGIVSRHLVTNNMSLRRSTLYLVGLFDERFRTGEDLDFCERALRLGVTLRFEPSIVVKHRDRERLLDFLWYFYKAGKDRIPIREKNATPFRWLLPRGLPSSLLLALPLTFLLPFQPIIAWWPYDKRVVLYYPWILLACVAMVLGIMSYFWKR